jgi:hypothetical protein
MFDFRDWNNSKSWSYVSGYLYYEEFSKYYEGEVQLQVLPYTYNAYNLKSIIGALLDQETFYEKIFIWLPHNNFSRETISNLRLATKKLFFIISESLLYTKDEISLLPHLENRWKGTVDLLLKSDSVINLCPLTHKRFLKEGFNSVFSYGLKPSYSILREKNILAPTIMFSAVLYDGRRESTFHKIQSSARRYGLEVIHPNDSLELTNQFEVLSTKLEECDVNGISSVDRCAISKSIFEVRKEIWVEYLSQMSQVGAVLSMPGFFKGLPGRIPEASIVKIPTIVLDSKLAFRHRRKLKRNGIYFTSSKNIRILEKIAETILRRLLGFNRKPDWKMVKNYV